MPPRTPSLGSELAKPGQWEETRQHLEAAVRLVPSMAAASQATLGIVLAAEGNYQEAQRHFEESLRLDPAQAEAQNNMCGVLMQLGRPARHCTEALKARPAYAKARINLAGALELCTGSFPELRAGTRRKSTGLNGSDAAMIVAGR
jgi:Flp pilus assembly protein TadD